MKARNILFLLIGVIIGISSTVGLRHIRRLQAIRALPSLVERNTPPGVDEIGGVTLSRHEGNLQLDIHGGMGNRYKNFEALLAEDRLFGIDDPVWGIYFEPGVTMDDVDSTLRTMQALGVRRYFLGRSFYGKLVSK